jgi:hypothetical protein
VSGPWAFEFEAPVGARVLGSRFIGITVEGDDCPWWDCDNRRWRADDEIAWGKGNPDRDYTLSSHAPCRSFKAFKRHLRRHGHKLAGHKVRLVCRFVDHDILAHKP